MEVNQVDIKKIRPYKNNAKKHPAKQIEQIAESLKMFGWQQPLVIDRNNTIVIGHGRYQAAKKLKMKSVPCVVADSLTGDEIKMLRLADNKLNESDWDFDLLASELDGLDFGDLDLDFDIPESDDNDGLDKPFDENEDTPYRYTKFWENCEKQIYPGVGDYDIPEIIGYKEIGDIGECIGFNYMLTEPHPEDKSIHFFLDDYQFQRLWNSPDLYIDRLKQFRYVFSPEFSTYYNWPLAIQIYNHYRKHWLGAYWQEKGVKVIPTIAWGLPPYKYEFDGEPEESVVAVSSVGNMNSKEGIGFFVNGYREMQRRLHPTQVLFYGTIPEELKEEKNIIKIDAFTDKWKKGAV